MSAPENPESQAGSGLQDKRRTPRIQVDYEAEFRVGGSERLESGQVRDLSPGGFLCEVGRSIDPGTGLSVTLKSKDSQTIAAAWVLRCRPRETGYQIACVFD